MVKADTSKQKKLLENQVCIFLGGSTLSRSESALNAVSPYLNLSYTRVTKYASLFEILAPYKVRNAKVPKDEVC